MEQYFMTSYVLLLAMTAGCLILCIIHMIRFRHFHRNFNRVVQNVQDYLRCVMEDDEENTGDVPGDLGGELMELDEEIPDAEGSAQRLQKIYRNREAAGEVKNMPEEKKEEVITQVLGEIFS